MSSEAVQRTCEGASWSTISALVKADGSATQRLARSLVRAPVAMRDLADAVHLICMLHGRHPGIIDHALARTMEPAARVWLEAALDGFARERALLARLASAAGPMPSTPGQSESEAAVVAQRHALDMLAQSDRVGCSVGAVVALVLDWPAIRLVLESAADRFGVQARSAVLPLPEETAAFVSEVSKSAAVERAMAFGVQQVLAQHRALWDLLEARTSARKGI